MRRVIAIVSLSCFGIACGSSASQVDAMADDAGPSAIAPQPGIVVQPVMGDATTVDAAGQELDAAEGQADASNANDAASAADAVQNDAVPPPPPPADAAPDPCTGFTAYVIQPGHGISLSSQPNAVVSWVEPGSDCAHATVLQPMSGVGTDVPCGYPARTFVYSAPSSAVTYRALYQLTTCPALQMCCQ